MISFNYLKLCITHIYFCKAFLRYNLYTLKCLCSMYMIVSMFRVIPQKKIFTTISHFRTFSSPKRKSELVHTYSFFLSPGSGSHSPTFCPPRFVPSLDTAQTWTQTPSLAFHLEYCVWESSTLWHVSVLCLQFLLLIMLHSISKCECRTGAFHEPKNKSCENYINCGGV